MDYDAVVYDLDGTLVELAVDWDQVREAVAAELRDRDQDPGGLTLWELLERAEQTGDAAAVLSTIASHERRGARNSTPLPAAAELPRSVPVGVCSLNCEAACRIALETHGLTEHVDAVVGRDTVSARKPAPEPLYAVLDRLGGTGRSVFVGDSETDREAATRAGVDFRHVDSVQGEETPVESG